jgi:two-component system response regulator FixJ
MSAAETVFVIDDDPGVRESLRALLEAAGYGVKDFSSAEAFLAQSGSLPGCLITDVRMPEMDGIALQEELIRRGAAIPIIVITGHGDVPLAVRAMKAGAIDFIEKPFAEDVLLDSVHRAVTTGRRAHDQAAEMRAARALLEELTPREREVLEHLVAGRANKMVAYELGISPRTVEIHRARIMDKFKARSLSDLVRISLAAAD